MLGNEGGNNSLAPNACLPASLLKCSVVPSHFQDGHVALLSDKADGSCVMAKRAEDKYALGGGGGFRGAGSPCLWPAQDGKQQRCRSGGGWGGQRPPNGHPDGMKPAGKAAWVGVLLLHLSQKVSGFGGGGGAPDSLLLTLSLSRVATNRRGQEAPLRT